jgi:prolyl oligopeptidase
MKAESTSRKRWVAAAPTNNRSTAVLASLVFAVFAHAAPPIDTPRQPVVQTYHNVVVQDDYQWLESATNPAVRDWTAKQNAISQAYFERLPWCQLIAEQLRQSAEESSAFYSSMVRCGGWMFALRFKPPLQQPVLVRFPSADRLFPRQTILDLNVVNTNGTASLDWFVPSWDGKLVAASVSEGGSEDGQVHFYQCETGRQLPDIIARAQFATGGGSAAWAVDGSGIFYTRYPHPGERSETDLRFYQQIYFHKLGASQEQDSYEIGREFPRIAEIDLTMREDGRWLLARVANGDGGEFAFWLRDSQNGRWSPIASFKDQMKQAAFGRDNAVYLLSTKNTPNGHILRLPVGSASLSAAEVVVPTSKAIIEKYAPCRNGLYVADLLGGPSQVRFFRAGSTRFERVPIPPISSASGLRCWEGDTLFFYSQSYTDPGGLLAYEPGAKQTRFTALREISAVNGEDLEATREFATSADGTKVPVNIVRRKGTKLDGSNPVLLHGYGGYGISQKPGFVAGWLRFWFDAGGVYAVANLRGGGEFGEEWHRAGKLLNKQNVFDDFIACAEHLIKRKYTRPAKLAVMGASNGGLLMGAFLTQRPDLARAVVSEVGLYDMLRIELDANGEFNTTEFGSVKDPAQFKALYTYSPYHAVKNHTAYPAVLLWAGENDTRVNPAQSRKMTARLQAATSSPYPILLRTSSTGGHGATGFSAAIMETAEDFAFLIDQLGIACEVRPQPLPVASAPRTPPESPSSDAAVLVQLERDWASKTDEFRHDVSFLERVLAPDFRYTHGDGTVRTRQQLIEACKADDAGIATADQMEVFINADTAIVIGRWRQGKRINRFTDTWVKREGRWINIAGQATPIADLDGPIGH